MTTWQQYWQNEGEQRNQDMLDALRARGGSYDQIKVRRIAAEEKMAANPGTGVGSVYNPVLGRPQVRDALGGTMAAGWNIGGAIADGTPVQLMGRGAGIVADAKQGRGSVDNLSAGTTADRTGSLPSSGGFSPTIPSDANGEDAYIAGPDGSCTLGNYAVGKAPPGSFKTLQECRKAQDSDYNCEGGVCKPVAKGTGKYKSIGECQAALAAQPFVWSPPDPNQKGVLVVRLPGGAWNNVGFSGSWSWNDITSWGQLDEGGGSCRHLLTTPGGNVVTGVHSCAPYEYGILFGPESELVQRRKCPS